MIAEKGRKMATAKAKSVKVRLTYDFDKRTLKTSPSRLRLRKGESVVFACTQGSVHILLSPATAYKPHVYRTGDAPVAVRRSAKGMIWCGGTFLIYGKKIKIDPAKKQYGSQNDPPPDDGGGS
jgi:hypothetical protein